MSNEYLSAANSAPAWNKLVKRAVRAIAADEGLTQGTYQDTCHRLVETYGLEAVLERVRRYGAEHPNIEWCKDVVRANKGERVTNEELETIQWDGLMGCYLMKWRGMTLGIETDGHIHS